MDLQHLFGPLDQYWTPSLHTGVSNVVNNALSGVAPEVATAILIYIMIQGFLIAFRQYDLWRGVAAMARAGAVGLLLTTAYFSQYVQTPFTTTIPAFIGQVVSGSSALQTGAQQFDQIWTNTLNFAAGINAQATGLYGIPYRIETVLILMIAELGLAIAFLIWEFAQTAINLVVCVGPFVIATYLFASLREIAARWLGKMIGLLVLMLLVSVLLQIVLASDAEAVRSAQASPVNVDVQLAALQTIAFTFLMAAGLLIFVPSIAAYIGGGAVFTVATAPLLYFSRMLASSNAARASGSAGRPPVAPSPGRSPPSPRGAP